MLVGSSLKELNQKIKIKLTKLCIQRDLKCSPKNKGREYLKNKEASKIFVKGNKTLKKKNLLMFISKEIRRDLKVESENSRLVLCTSWLGSAHLSLNQENSIRLELKLYL